MASSQIIILAIIATSLATFISRFMGALTSEKVSVKSKIFQWFNCVAYSTLAALIGRMIIFPAGVLAESEVIIRIIVFIICIALFIISKKNLGIGIVAKNKNPTQCVFSLAFIIHSFSYIYCVYGWIGVKVTEKLA